MPFDGLFLYKLNSELSGEISSRADKIHQPSGDELVFFLRGKSGTKRLIVNLSATPRLYFSENSPENPSVPPRFCTVLRKYLSGARLKAVYSENTERVCHLSFDTFNEMGDEVSYTLVLELLSASANAILIDTNRKIIDALRRSDLEKEERIIHSGATYIEPPLQNKYCLLIDEPSVIAEKISNSNAELWQAVLETVGGISPLAAREISYNIENDITKRCEYVENLKEKAERVISEFKAKFLADSRPVLIYKNGLPADFYWCKLKHISENQVEYESLSSLLQDFYFEKQKREQQAAKTGELSRYLTTLRARIARKLLARQGDLEKCKNAEMSRIKGELIKANIYVIEKGSPFADLQNYYSEDLELIRIALDPALSPADNAARYFKEYKKQMTAKNILDSLISECEAELDYIDSVIEALSRTSTTSELEEIKLELVSQGYLRIIGGKKIKRQTTAPKKHISPSGFEILIGRNNTENDRLTMQIAEKNDYWFHAKDIHGSHVIVRCDGKTPDNDTLTLAARLAAENSRAKNSALVPVDMTLVRYVKKPTGAKPGKVVYTNQKTVYVTPNS